METGHRERGSVPVLALVGWAGLAALLLAAFFSTIGALNATVYGSSTFVERYLSAIADDRIAEALRTPGVAMGPDDLEEAGLAPDTSTALLRANVIEAGPQNVVITGDAEGDDGVRTVTASYRLGTAISESTFRVRPIEALWGVLNQWEFAESPLAVIDVTVKHGALFEVGSLTLDTRATKSGDELAAFSHEAPYLAMAPAQYSFSYQSRLLEAFPAPAAVTAGGRSEVVLESQPTGEFVEIVQEKVDTFLDECAAQEVLQPAGCPFGIEIDDRVTSAPEWTIVAYPPVTLTPGESSFDMAPTEGTAHISVETQSLFDGGFFMVEEDRPISVGLSVTIKPDGSPAIQLR